MRVELLHCTTSGTAWTVEAELARAPHLYYVNVTTSGTAWTIEAA